jgi:uncharacterized integral membrane protein
MTDAGRSDDRGHAGRVIRPIHVVVGICALVLLVFALVNLDRVSVDFVFDSVEVSLIVVIALCAGLGFVIGWFVGRHRRAGS